MLRKWSLLLVFLLIISALFTQDLHEEEETPAPPVYVDTDWYEYRTNLYSRGDKTFNMTLGLIFPTLFSGLDNDIGLSIGGTGTLAYNYFLTSNIFLGGELSGMFCFTRMGNSLFIIPFGARFGYQFVLRRIEIPLSLMIGMAPQLYLGESYFGWLVLKPGASIFWRHNADWSFGLNTIWWWVPQWPKPDVDGIRRNVYGNFLELTLSARYHF